MTRTSGSLAGRVAVVGNGIAGMMTALSLAPRPVVLVTRSGLSRDGSSEWEQDGIGAATGPGGDPGQHLADTCRVGAGGIADVTPPADPSPVRQVVSAIWA